MYILGNSGGNMKFKYRKEPEKPERRESIHRTEYISSFSNLYEIFKYFNKLEVDLKNVKVHSYYDDDSFIWDSPETDQEFDSRMAEYKKQLENYNKWYSVNKDKAIQYEAEQKIKEEERRKRNEIIQEKRAEAKRKKLLKQQKEIQKELEKLGVK